MKRAAISLILISSLLLTSCSYEWWENRYLEHEKEEKEAREYVMKEMEIELAEKYADILDADPDDDDIFDVYDVRKGTAQSWWSFCYHPAKAQCYLDEFSDEEFDVQIETDGEKFGTLEDNYYGILYGEDIKEELYDILSDYPIEDVEMTFEPSEDVLKDDDDLRANLLLTGKYDVTDPDDLDEFCDLMEKLEDLGYKMIWITVYSNDGKYRSTSTRNGDVDEIREFFED